MDMNNDYSHAGKGFKARQRMRLDDIPKKIAKPQTEGRRNRKPIAIVKEEREGVQISERGLKGRIIRYTLALANVTEIAQRLDAEGFGPRTKVLIAGVRNWTLDILRVAQEEGLIDEDRLERYRKRKAKEQRERFKSTRDRE